MLGKICGYTVSKSLNPFHARLKTESTAFLNTVKAKETEIQPLIVDMACWYLNGKGKSFHEKFKYKIVKCLFFKNKILKRES